MQNNVFLRLAQERYTTKHYNGQQIPREEFDTLLEILRLTPTSVNAQALHWKQSTKHHEKRQQPQTFVETLAQDNVVSSTSIELFCITRLLDGLSESLVPMP